jgi:hypothetical protein
MAAANTGAVRVRARVRGNMPTHRHYEQRCRSPSPWHLCMLAHNHNEDDECPSNKDVTLSVSRHVVWCDDERDTQPDASVRSSDDVPQ